METDPLAIENLLPAEVSAGLGQALTDVLTDEDRLLPSSFTDNDASQLGSYLNERRQRGEWNFGLPKHWWINGSRGYSQDQRINGFYPSGEYIGKSYCSPGEEPDWSCIVPVALQTENLTRVSSLLHSIADECESGAGISEITIWTNTEMPPAIAADPESDGACEFTDATFAKYYDFVEELQSSLPSFYGVMDIRVVHNFLSPFTDKFQQIRQNSTELIAVQSVFRHFSDSHVIGWIDVDSPRIQRHAIVEVQDALWHNRAHFARAFLVIEEDDPATLSLPLWQRSDAAKVAGFYGLARYLLESNLGFTEPRGYVDESGLFFTRKKFLQSTGIGMLDPKKGESKTLLKNAAERLDPNIPLLGYTNGEIGNSNRRFKWFAGRILPIKLPDIIEGDDYVDYLSMDKSMPERSEPVTVAQVWDMVDYMQKTQQKRTPEGQPGFTQPQWEELKKYVAECAFADSIAA